MRKNLSFLLLIYTLFFGLNGISQTNPCIEFTDFHIVVLGSSTAAGSGATPIDSSWVNLYQDYLKNINPENKVTNLAVGGFNTYRIMPTSFTPPPNRPQPDTNHNITKAISLSPDGIIVNLPSNDVSSGYSVAEQLANFDTIVSIATSAGIPIWICTTQPKNFNGNQTNIQKQLDVRDSILIKYSPFTLDFWTGLADTTNQLHTSYDSGDGTHLNNDGHALLFDKVVTKNILDVLYSSNAIAPDYTTVKIEFLDGPICGVPHADLEVTYLNEGLDDLEEVTIQLVYKNADTGVEYFYQNSMPGLLNCEIGYTNFTVPTQDHATYYLTALIISEADTITYNDTLFSTVEVPGIPTIETIGNIGCQDQEQVLQANAEAGDSIRWFDAQVGGSFLGGGSSFTTPNLTANTTFFAEAVRGTFHETGMLQASTTQNIIWNGTMFDLVADTLLTIDSITLVIADTGYQNIELYTKQGTHRGFETNAAVWQFEGAFPVYVIDSLAPATFHFPANEIQAGDSLAIYIQLANPNARLGYQTLSDSIVITTPELTMIAGSGSNHNFGGSYYPRYWAGQLYYQFGEKPDGDCTSPREPAIAIVNQVSVDLGADTILHTSAAILLDAGTGFAEYEWSDGSTEQTLLLEGNLIGEGIYTYAVTVTDSIGCSGYDEIIIVFAPIVEISDINETPISIAPNPASNDLCISIPAGKWKLKLIDVNETTWIESHQQLDLSNTIHMPIDFLPNGVYFLQMESEGIQKAIMKIAVVK